MSASIKIVLSLLIIGGAAGYLLYSTMGSPEALSYFYGADEVIVNKATFTGQKIRVGGYVEECSILQKKGTMEYRFEVRPDHPHKMEQVLKHPEAKGKTITVAYTGVVPDTFKDNAEITVAGTLLPDGTFAAQDLTAKCPSKYEAAEKDMAQKAPPKKDCTALRAQQTATTGS